MAGLTYRDAGVDIDAGEQLVQRIKPLAQATHTEHVLGALGGFAGLCALPEGIEDPVLVSGTDGVGTESSWGLDDAGQERGGSAASATCGVTVKDSSATCP